MQVLIVLGGAALFWGGVALVTDVVQGWVEVGAWSLATMLVFTASAHFTPMRADLERMVPPVLPTPGLLVTITGVLEVLIALALVFDRARALGGAAAAVLFVLLFPANVHASRTRVSLHGRPPTPLPARAVMQLLFVVLAVWIAARA